MAHVLLYFADYIYERDEFELPISRREIAEYIGMIYIEARSRPTFIVKRERPDFDQ